MPRCAAKRSDGRTSSVSTRRLWKAGRALTPSGSGRFRVRSVDEVLELLRSAGFVPDRLDTALFPGLPGGEAVAGPSSSDRADYVRVLATRR